MHILAYVCNEGPIHREDVTKGMEELTKSGLCEWANEEWLIITERGCAKVIEAGLWSFKMPRKVSDDDKLDSMGDGPRVLRSDC